MKVVSFKICPFVQRVTALLEAKEVSYETEYISLKSKPQWFEEISPHGQVPVLITDNGQPLFESDAIVEYLEEAYPVLSSASSLEQKAINRAWGYLATKHYLVQCSAQRSADQATLNARSLKLEKAFSSIEGALGDTPYFNAQSVDIVDIAWLPLLHRAAIIEKNTGYDFVGNYPKLKKWQRTLLASGLAEKSVSEDFERVFTDFYLSADTYLGNKANVCDQPVGQGCESCC